MCIRMQTFVLNVHSWETLSPGHCHIIFLSCVCAMPFETFKMFQIAGSIDLIISFDHSFYHSHTYIFRCPSKQNPPKQWCFWHTIWIFWHFVYSLSVYSSSVESYSTERVSVDETNVCRLPYIYITLKIFYVCFVACSVFVTSWHFALWVILIMTGGIHGDKINHHHYHYHYIIIARLKMHVINVGWVENCVVMCVSMSTSRSARRFSN